MRRVQIAIVGAGPAGLAAAIAAAEAKAEVLVIDEAPRPGGQIYRQPPTTFDRQPQKLSFDQLEGARLLQRCNELSIEFLPQTLVWGIFDNRHLALMTGTTGTEVWAEKVILAPGAYERPVPFPGWTLPGVMTAGGVQNMIKGQWVLPGARFLLVGSGPLQLLVAKQLLQCGAQVVGVADAASWKGSWRNGLQMFHDWPHFRQGLGLLWNLRKNKVSFMRGHAILRAEGDGQLARVVTADVDEDWHPIPGTEKSWNVDSVCVGYGFVSSTELPALAGCRIRYDPLWNSWVPEHDDNMVSSVPGVYVVGDGAGLGGAVVAALEGHIAGVNAAGALGYDTAKHTRSARSSHARLNRLRKFRAALDGLWQFRNGLYDLIHDDTIICRCEEIRYAEIKKAIADGAVTAAEIKAATRAGMGLCQGRFCSINIAHLLSLATNKPMKKDSVRPPVKPVPIDGFFEKKI